MLTKFSKFSFSLLMWFFTNGLIFLVPQLSWVKYPILLNLETFVVVLLSCCIYDASHWKPWKENVSRFNVTKKMVFSKNKIVSSFRDFLKRFGALALVWSLEIILQKMIFTTVFTSTTHYIDRYKDPLIIENEEGSEGGGVALSCMDGTLLFSIRQMAIILVLMGTFVLERNQGEEVKYLTKTIVPVIMISVGAFLSVWNNQSHQPSVGQVFLALLWIIIRTIRLILTKWVQNAHYDVLSATRFFRLVIPIIIAILLPFFLLFEVGEMVNSSEDGSAVAISDVEWIQIALLHLAKVSVYSVLLFSGSMILFTGGNAVDYISWIMLREVLWNTACGYAVSAGEFTSHKMGAHQIAGLVVFFVGWPMQVVLSALQSTFRSKQVHHHRVKMVEIKTKKKQVPVQEESSSSLLTRRHVDDHNGEEILEIGHHAE